MARTYYPKEQKMRIVREALETGNAAAVSRRHEIHANLLYQWIRKYRDSGEDAFQTCKCSRIALSNVRWKETMRN